MLSGFHAPNSAFTEDDYRVINLMGAQSAKLLQTSGTQHTAADTARLRTEGVNHFCVRLPDSVRPDGKIGPDWEYAGDLIRLVIMWHSLGVRWFQIDNEPNWTWVSQELGPFQYQWYMKRVMRIVRSNVPGDVVLIAPPLSFAPALWTHGEQNPTKHTLDEWLAAYMWTDGGREPSLFAWFHLASAHPYWQSDRQLHDPSFGRCYDVIHQKSGGMEVVCPEYGFSGHLLTNVEGEPLYTPEQVDDIRARHYAMFLENARAEGYVPAAYTFLVGGTSDWTGFQLTERVARAMRPVQPAPPQDTWLGQGRVIS